MLMKAGYFKNNDSWDFPCLIWETSTSMMYCSIKYFVYAKNVCSNIVKSKEKPIRGCLVWRLCLHLTKAEYIDLLRVQIPAYGTPT